MHKAAMPVKVGTPATTGIIGKGAVTMTAVTAVTAQARGNGPHTAGMTTDLQARDSRTAPLATTDLAVMIGRIAAMTVAVRVGVPPALRVRIVRTATTARTKRTDMIVPIAATTAPAVMTARTEKTGMTGRISGQPAVQTGRKKAVAAGRADVPAPATANSNLCRRAFKFRR